MKKFRIGLDLDGVVADHTQHKIQVAKTLGFAVRKKETHTEVLKQLMPEGKYRLLQKSIYGAMSLRARPVVSAKLTIRRLARRGHELFIISRRGENAREGFAWLKMHRVLDSVPRKHVVFVDADAGKAPAVKKFGIEIFLDDKTKVLAHLTMIAYPVLFNNFKVNINSARYIEVHSWEEFLSLVDEMSICT